MKIVIEGIQPYDGRYDFDFDWNRREYGWIKRYADYLPLAIDEGLRGVDADLLGVFGLIALCRAGKIQTTEAPDIWELFQEAPGLFSVTLELDPADQEDDAGPPPESSSEKSGSSGDGSKTSSATSDATPPPAGTPALATSGSRPAS